MPSFGLSWQSLAWLLALTIPDLVVWCVAVVFCFTRRRENPTGAKYLGLAVMLQFLSVTFSHLFPYTWGWFEDGTQSRTELFNNLYNVSLGVKICANVVSWSLVIMAVFARPALPDYFAGPDFDDVQD